MNEIATDELLYEIRGTTGWVTLNRPEARNALTFAMYEGLAKVCSTIPEDGSVRAIVITGAGGFIAGALVRHFHDQGFTRIRAIDKKPLPRWYQWGKGFLSMARIWVNP